jgi:hypothetical protein
MIFNSDNINGDEKYLEKSLNQLFSIHNQTNLSGILFSETNVGSMIKINYSSYFSVKCFSSCWIYWNKL